MLNALAKNNLSLNAINNFSRPLNEKIMLVQVLVGIFLSVNCLMIFTFLKKEFFREDTHYILFGQTLFVDSELMVMTDMLLIGAYFQYPILMIPCIIACTIINILTICTPLTVVAMCLERYVAICMSLRQANISTSRSRIFGILVIWAISSIVPLFIIITYLSMATPDELFSYTVCSVEIMLTDQWHAVTRATILQVLFLLMMIVIALTYIKIMVAAKAASTETKTFTKKSLKTVALHGFQLFLCLMQFLTPFIEMAFWKVNIIMINNLRFSNFIVFIITPCCLSPLIYGLRAEKLFFVIRHYAMCGFDNLFPVFFTRVKIRPSKNNLSMKPLTDKIRCEIIH